MPPIKKYKGKIYVYNRDRKKFASSSQYQETLDTVAKEQSAKQQPKKKTIIKDAAKNERETSPDVNFFGSYAKFNCFWYQNEQNLWKPEMRESPTFTIVNRKGYLYGGIGKKVIDEWCSVDLTSIVFLYKSKFTSFP